MYDFDFNTTEYLKIKELCNLREEKFEAQIFELKRKGKSNIQIAMALNISERTVSRRLKTIDKKILKIIHLL